MSSNPQKSLIKFQESFFKRLFDNFHGVVLFLCGSGLVLFGAYHAYHHFIVLRNKVLYESHLLHRKIINSQKKYHNLMLFNVLKRQSIEDPNNSLAFEVILIDKLKSKPSLHENSIKKADPFLPPFEEGQFISELSPTHNLLFNKFALVKSHVLITTKAPEAQKRLNFLDFIAMTKTMKALDGFAFFNCGENSGYSVQHKHIQAIPNKSGIYSVFELIKEKIKEKALISNGEDGSFLLKEFRFRHIIRVMESHNNEENIEKIAEVLLKNYLKALETLENEEEKKSYNAIFTEDWILIVLREKENALGGISLNSMGFSGIILVKEQKELDKIVELGNPMKLLEEVSMK